MKKITIPKSYLFTGLALLAMIFGFTVAQSIIVNVSAQIPPIAFMGPDINFGLVFPGEILGKNFYVQASSDYVDPIPYTLITQVKPRYEYTNEVGWGPASDYCLLNPNDYEKCYPLLCPYLSVVSEENEGDSQNDANLKETEGDNIDYWSVALNVPQLQGEYGCDVKLGLGSEENGGSCDNDTICETGENCETCPTDCGCGGDGGDGPVATFFGSSSGGGSGSASGEVAGESTTQEEQEGEVLGESIILPETGNSPVWGIIFGLIILLGAGFILKKQFKC